MISDPFFYLCAIPAVILFGIAKGGFGGTLSIVAVPLMALAVPPVVAASILLPILCVMDILAVRAFWQHWHWPNLRVLLPAALLGILLGTLSFRYFSEGQIRILIGAIAVAFVLHYWLKPQQSPASPVKPWSGRLWGAVAGFTSFGIHAGGPPLSIYLLPQRLPPKLYMGTCAIFFMVVNYTKLIPYFWLGQLTSTNLMTSLVLLPLAPLGIRLGYWLLHRIDPQWFYRIIYFFLLLTGCKLLYEGWLSW
ncbi:sulfite exporter TauE/SafE family protein [Balneatrix alpica]|uniref:Probable membrane transporter protein n=1 Tax=Balneatrix alpica TaxID=75684 RepID=A0ABV5ZEU9_9GAMM|nr:sulfite exporter TauE/SafE family protein [Balneatrix alpica]